MKIYISNYRNHWISPYIILDKFLFWRKNYDAYAQEPPKWLNFLCESWKKFLDTIHPRVNYIKVDEYDTWNADVILATIIVPVLKLLKENKYGSPMTDYEDAPEEFRSYNSEGYDPADRWDGDKNMHKRWNWVLDEMIYAFENVSDDKWEELCYIDNEFNTEIYESYNNRINNGLRLFSKYYRGLWN